MNNWAKRIGTLNLNQATIERDKLYDKYMKNPTKDLEQKLIDIESYIRFRIEKDMKANLRSPSDKKFNGHTPNKRKTSRYA